MNIFNVANLVGMTLQNVDIRPYSIVGRIIEPYEIAKTLPQLGIDFCTFKQIYGIDDLVKSWFDLGLLISVPIAGSSPTICAFEATGGTTTGGSGGTVSSGAPTNPQPGDTWIRLPDSSSFIWDSVRGKWLGKNHAYNVGRGFFSTQNLALFGVADTPTSQTPLRIPRNETLTGITMEANSTNAWSVQVRDFTSHVPITGATANIAGSKTDSVLNLNIDFTAGQEIEIYLAAVTGISFPRVVLYTKERG